MVTPISNIFAPGFLTLNSLVYANGVNSVASAQALTSSDGHFAFGPGATVDPDLTSYGLGPTDDGIYVLSTFTDSPSAINQYGMSAGQMVVVNVKMTAEIAGSGTNYFTGYTSRVKTDPAGLYGSAGYMWIGGGDFKADHDANYHVENLYGITAASANNGNGTVTNLYAAYFDVRNNGDANIQDIYGIYFGAQNYGAGNISLAYGLLFYIYNAGSGVIQDAYGCNNYVYGGGGGIVNAYNYYADYSGGPGHTNVYGFYCVDQSQTPSSGQNWNFYSSNSNGSAKNYFGGKLATDQSAAATTPGTVTHKMPIYDAAASLVGYVPVYDAIT